MRDQDLTLNEMKKYLEAHGVEEGSFYTHGGLGGGDIDGIECNDGQWYTYFSERGKKRRYVKHESEHQACQFVLSRAEEYAKRLGAWKTANSE